MPVVMAFILLYVKCPAQISNYFYAISYTLPPAYNFVKIEMTTGAMTNLYQLPGTGYSSASSSCINASSERYYFCSGTELFTFSPVTGNLLSAVTLPISSTALFTFIQVNPCDSNIYGIINDYPASISFARYNPALGTMTIISQLNINTQSCSGCMSVIDPVAGIYAVDNGGILGLSLSTGQVIYNAPFVNLPGESFHHIALYCPTHTFYGTSANGSAKFLSTVDPGTGIITHVSTNGWNTGLNKPANGGSIIDQTSGIYYYSGDPSNILGASTVSGNLVYNQPMSNGSYLVILFLQHFSECSCLGTGINEPLTITDAVIFPDPFNDVLNCRMENNEPAEIILYDVASKEFIFTG